MIDTPSPLRYPGGKTILYEKVKGIFDTIKFCEDIKNINVDLKEWEKQKEIYNNQYNHSIYEVGLATFFLNRTNRSGIIKGGPIGGKKQEGKYKIDCRFNKIVLINKIEEIGKLRSRIKLFNYDVNHI